MKKIILSLFVVSLLSSCFIFKKKEKYGCPGSPQPGQLTNDQKIAQLMIVRSSGMKNGLPVFYDQEVVVDKDQLVTSRTPDDLPAFNREALRLLGA